jgi:DNA repair protein RadC
MPVYSFAEPGIDSSDGRAADLLLAGADLRFEATRPLSGQYNTTLFPREQPLRRTQRLRKWMSIDATLLADHEILEMILTPVVPRRRTRQIARALLMTFGTVSRVLQAPAIDLMAVEGMGEAGIVALKAAGVAALHMLRKAVTDPPEVRTGEELKNYLSARLQNERVEVFFVIFLDSGNRVIADEELGRGTIDHTPAYPREVVRRCLELDSTAIILVHNHPSGILTPSREDVALTSDIAKAASTMGIEVHDHIIVGRGECLSFRAEKLL